MPQIALYAQLGMGLLDNEQAYEAFQSRKAAARAGMTAIRELQQQTIAASNWKASVVTAKKASILSLATAAGVDLTGWEGEDPS